MDSWFLQLFSANRLSDLALYLHIITMSCNYVIPADISLDNDSKPGLFLLHPWLYIFSWFDYKLVDSSILLRNVLETTPIWRGFCERKFYTIQKYFDRPPSATTLYWMFLHLLKMSKIFGFWHFSFLSILIVSACLCLRLCVCVFVCVCVMACLNKCILSSCLKSYRISEASHNVFYWHFTSNQLLSSSKPILWTIMQRLIWNTTRSQT